MRNESTETAILYIWKMATTTPKSGSKSLVTVIKEYGLKPLTKKNILFYYSPVLGAASYTVLSVNVMNPGLVVR
jgi:hypothetical protein